MNKIPPMCSTTVVSGAGRVQYNDRDTVPIVVSDSGWRPVLQRRQTQWNLNLSGNDSEHNYVRELLVRVTLRGAAQHLAYRNIPR